MLHALQRNSRPGPCSIQDSRSREVCPGETVVLTLESLVDFGSSYSHLEIHVPSFHKQLLTVGVVAHVRSTLRLDSRWAKSDTT